MRSNGWPPRGCCTPATAAWCPRWPPAATWSWWTRWPPTRSSAPAPALDDIESVAVTRGPGPDRGPARGGLVGQGAGRRPRLPLVAGGSPARPRGGRARSRPSRSRRRTCAWWPAAATPSWRGWRTRAPTRCWARRSTTPPARRSTRAPACSGSATPAAPRSTGWRARATPRRSTSRARPPARLDFSFSGLKTALLYKVRDLGEEETRERRGRPGRLLPARDRGRARGPRCARRVERERPERLAIGGGVAANSELRGRLAELCGELGVQLWAPPMELCTDNAAMIAARRALHRAAGLPRLPGPRRGGAAVTRRDALRQGRAAACATRRGRRSPRCGPSAPSISRRWTCRSTRVLQSRLRGAHPGGGGGRRGGLRAAAWTPTSLRERAR